MVLVEFYIGILSELGIHYISAPEAGFLSIRSNSKNSALSQRADAAWECGKARLARCSNNGLMTYIYFL